MVKKHPRNSFVQQALRSASMKWKPRNEAMKAARVDRGMYRCNECKEVFHYKSIKMDHKQPVVAVEGLPLQESGEIDWNTYIPRLLCFQENWQALHEGCHDIKTAQENELRSYYRDLARQKEKTKINKKYIKKK